METRRVIPDIYFYATLVSSHFLFPFFWFPFFLFPFFLFLVLYWLEKGTILLSRRKVIGRIRNIMKNDGIKNDAPYGHVETSGVEIGKRWIQRWRKESNRLLKCLVLMHLLLASTLINWVKIVFFVLFISILVCLAFVLCCSFLSFCFIATIKLLSLRVYTGSLFIDAT